MKNLLPWGSSGADLAALRSDLVALGQRLEQTVTVLETLAKAHNALPEAIVEKAVAEVRQAAKDTATAAWVHVKRHVVENLVKWGWRVALAWIGTQGVIYLSQIAEQMHK